MALLHAFATCCVVFVQPCTGALKIVKSKDVDTQPPYAMPPVQSPYSQLPSQAYFVHPQGTYPQVAYGSSGQLGTYLQPPYDQQGMYVQAAYAPQPVAAQPLYGLDQLQFAAPVTPELKEGWRNLTAFFRKSGQRTAVKVNKTLQELKPSIEVFQATLNKIGKTVGSLSPKVNATANVTANGTANATEPPRFVKNLRKLGKQALHNIEESAVVAGAMDGYLHDKTALERALYKTFAIGGIWIDPHNRVRMKTLFEK
eukprot:CAMPEP_0171099128 /NCGR_PEP_ID=MMETSP0766_2-20121228/50538_1 /TAXON_ID=439317 /ORGANISM="Gambierdiscus australes, Strain CAWD 149" /LENGTH=255 /DNA_ID=CAMNT_0011558667 /DNA_START=92 /DNA_END=859 /DNA_ORIENTATION=+